MIEPFRQPHRKLAATWRSSWPPPIEQRRSGPLIEAKPLSVSVTTEGRALRFEAWPLGPMEEKESVSPIQSSMKTALPAPATESRNH